MHSVRDIFACNLIIALSKESKIFSILAIEPRLSFGYDLPRMVFFLFLKGGVFH